MNDAKKHIILNVDDDAAGRYAISRVLLRAGFEVWEAATGTEALQKAAQGPDLLVLDIHLPDLNGFEVCRRLKADPATRRLPVLHLSATCVQPSDRALGLDGGADGYLTQPVDPIELVATVRSLLRAKEAEAKLREAEAWFRTTLYSIGDAVIATDRDGRIRQTNPVTEALTGWQEEEARGRPLEEVFHIINEETRQAVENPVQRVLREGVVVGLGNHTLLLSRDGTERPIADAGAPIHDDQGRITGVVLVFRDQTEERAAQHALRMASKRWQTTFDAIADPVALLKPDGTIMQCNREFIAFLGQDAQAVLGQKCFSLIHQTDHHIEGCPLVRALQSGVREEMELAVGAGTFSVAVDPIVAPDGQVTGFVQTMRDMTAWKQAEEALKQSEARYRAIMEQSADGIFLTDPQTRCLVEANTAFQRLLGYPQEEIPTLCIYDLAVAPREEIDRRFDELLLKKEPTFLERQYRRKDGSLVEVWINSSVISYGGKQVVCTIVRDLTEKKALEAQLLRAQRMETIGLLAGGIAHDLNNILSPILMNTELLEQEADSASQQKLLSSIQSSAQRGADIVRQILTFSRGMEGERSLLFPSPLLKEIEHFLQETFPKTIQIRTDLPKDLYPVWGDATQLHQVLMNLCLNAKDAMPKGGTLFLSAKNLMVDESYAKMYPEAQVGPYLCLTISDTGSGIAPEHLSEIFDPFFTTKERGKGTGLGLATVLALVKGHGGFLSVESEVGQGSTFRICLPASPATEGEAALLEREALPLGSGQLLLVVEDEESIREILKTTLETFGYSVLPASDGAEAVSLYAQHKEQICLMITDMGMPIMDGPATIRVLHRMSPSLPIIAISGADWQEKAAEGTGLKIEAFLSKPFTGERMLRVVAEVLKKA